MALAKEPSLPRRVVSLVGGGLVVLFMLCFLLGLVGVRPFTTIPGYMGLELGSLGGVFIDCSQYHNRNHDFCRSGGSRLARQQSEASERQFREIDKNALPFSLHR